MRRGIYSFIYIRYYDAVNNYPLDTVCVQSDSLKDSHGNLPVYILAISDAY